MGVLLLVAGHETTADMIALGTLALLEHPDQLALLRDTDDPKLVVSAVEELLRYLNIPHNGRRRVALEGIEFAGETIRAGDGVILPRPIPDPAPVTTTLRPSRPMPCMAYSLVLRVPPAVARRDVPRDPHAGHGNGVCPRTRRRSGGVAGDRVRDSAEPRPHGFGAGAAFRSRRPRLW